MRVCIFCGSSEGVRSDYAELAHQLGRSMAHQGMGLVYGGGRRGLMGVIADSVLQAGGEAIGVIPRGLLEREQGHRALTELHVVETMHERKAKMSDLANAFVVLPGGLGTLEEMFEVWTWAQLGIHQKPLALMNIAGYFDKLLSFLWTTQEEGFTRRDNLWMLMVEQDPEKLIERIRTYQALPVQRWLQPDQT